MINCGVCIDTYLYSLLPKRKAAPVGRRRFAFGYVESGYFSRMISTRRLACS